MSGLWNEILAGEEILLNDRRYLHQNPEIGLELPETVAYVKARLDEAGIVCKPCGAEVPEATRQRFALAGQPDMKRATGIVATIGSGKPCILLRADMDALPMREENGLSFASRKPYAHMCGHDAHTAMLLAAARYIKAHEDTLKGTIKLMFQPGEELGHGAKLMIEDGVLENPKVDVAMALHVSPTAPVGSVTYCEGLSCCSMDIFNLKVFGKGGHSSQPQDTVDPILILNQIYTALNLLVGRETAPSSSATLTVGTQRAGSAVNIIPDSGELQLSVRTYDTIARERLIRRIPEIVKHYVTAWNGTYDLRSSMMPSTVCDIDFCNQLRPFVEELVGEGNLLVVPPLGATEDFGSISEQVPSAYLTLGAGSPTGAPLHNSGMVLDETGLVYGAALYANCAIKWLEHCAG